MVAPLALSAKTELMHHRIIYMRGSIRKIKLSACRVFS